MSLLIPLWFYEVGSIMYVVATVVAGLLAYYSFKLYDLTGKRQHMLLHSGFIFITAGFLALSFSNIYSFWNFESCQDNCRFNPYDPVYNLIKFGNYGYYATSLIGYLLIGLSYSGGVRIKGRKLFATVPIIDLSVLVGVQVLYPFINSFFSAFHFLSLVILFYIILKRVSGHLMGRNQYMKLNFMGFVFIAIYHLLMLISPFEADLFALAHLSLLVGFGSMLMMLVQVNRK